MMLPRRRVLGSGGVLKLRKVAGPGAGQVNVSHTHQNTKIKDANAKNAAKCCRWCWGCFDCCCCCGCFCVTSHSNDNIGTYNNSNNNDSHRSSHNNDNNNNNFCGYYQDYNGTGNANFLYSHSTDLHLKKNDHKEGFKFFLKIFI